MRKQSKRQIRPKVIPTMAFLYSVPDLEIAILSAVAAFRGGYASPGQFDILLDTRDLLLLGAVGAKLLDVDSHPVAYMAIIFSDDSAARYALGPLRVAHFSLSLLAHPCKCLMTTF